MTPSARWAPEYTPGFTRSERTAQILIQIQQTAIQSQRALNVSRQQIAGKDRERRILQLTIEEIKGLDEDVNLYKGVGKM